MKHGDKIKEKGRLFRRPEAFTETPLTFSLRLMYMCIF